MAKGQINGRMVSQNHERNSAGTKRARVVTEQLTALHDQLIATRLELLHGILPRAERITVTSGDVDLVVGQIDAAIVRVRTILAALVG